MTPADRIRLLKFCRLLASDQDGERSTAASMANKLAEKLGGWDKVIATGVADSPNNTQDYSGYAYQRPRPRPNMWEDEFSRGAESRAAHDLWEQMRRHSYNMHAQQEAERQRRYQEKQNASAAREAENVRKAERQQQRDAEASKRDARAQQQAESIRKNQRRYKEAWSQRNREAEATKSPPPNSDRQNFEDLFNKNFASAHAQGHDFNSAFADKSQWTETELEEVKKIIEKGMRAAGVWKDFT